MRSIEVLLAEISARHFELDGTAEEAELLNAAPPALVDVMRELRVPLVKVPSEIGGDELPMASQLRYFEALSYSNPTAGWTGFNHAGAAGICGAKLSDAGIEAVFGSDAVPFLGAVSAPSGTFSFVDGGIQLSGHYRYASGAAHAQWFFLAGVESAGDLSVRLAAVSADDVSLSDNWDVMALKGTGSVDVTLNEVFVPDHLLADPFASPLRGGPMYKLGYQAYVAGENLGFSMGVCQRLVDEIARYASTKSRGSDGRLADRGAFQYELGKTQLEVEAARAFGLGELAAADDQCANNNGLSSSEEQKIVAMLAFSTESSVNAVSRLYHFAGAAAIFNSSVLQRCFRDAHGSAMHHVASNVAYDKYGQELLATPDRTE
jgi:alkylation response protein AidB-like acyl-CoA dehydrogenase